ncbi:MAG: histidine kinase [Methylophilaceae bacterium 17-44-8]|jgi:hypothetical protein|nr:MAG: histidine kinase [Methylophilales bacterium 28-44-11]OYZ10669.1 MAG: histidine kinase [Methylophilales bacterium 16-45-7]OZA06830.1 MAG: histidine kinase [Methylophilaceae bacterium 17-44-8]
MSANSTLCVATGLAKGATASPELAAEAVRRALEKAGLETAQCVVLYMTSEFAHAPQAAIRAASKAAQCTHIIGCSAVGIFTEEDWVLDGAAVAALVLSQNVFSNQPKIIADSEYLLTLAAPSAVNASWLTSHQPRLGAISGDATGHGAFSVWQDGKGVSQGYCAFGIQHSQVAVAASHGLKWLSNARKITASKGFDLQSVANLPALTSLQAACPMYETTDDLPLHLLSIAYAPSAKDFEHDEYELASIIIANQDNFNLTLSQSIPEGYWIRWAMRDAETAQSDLRKTIHELSLQLHGPPAFACMFSCLARGPYYYGGNDEDLDLLKTHFPNMPMIGFYGNGQIAPMMGKNTLLQYSLVLALFGPSKESYEFI